MKLEKWALVAEIVGSVAIVVTLVFLIAEIRANSQLTERQIALEQTDRLSRAILESETLARLMAHIDDVDGSNSQAKLAIRERYGFDPGETELVTRYYRQQWFGYIADFRLGSNDRLAEQVSLMLTFPDQKLFWEGEAIKYDADFTRFVDEVVIPGMKPRLE